jgi:hypothetical protein
MGLGRWRSGALFRQIPPSRKTLLNSTALICGDILEFALAGGGCLVVVSESRHASAWHKTSASQIATGVRRPADDERHP